MNTKTIFEVSILLIFILRLIYINNRKAKVIKYRTKKVIKPKKKNKKSTDTYLDAVWNEIEHK